MTVQLTWDTDPPITGLPDQGTDTKTYPPTPAPAEAELEREPVGSGTVLDAPFSVPLVTTADATEVAPGGTVTVDGSGLAPGSAGTLAIVAGPAGTEGGTVLVETPVTADTVGAIPSTELTVPDDADPGAYHLVLSGGAVVIDLTGLTVTGVTPPDPIVTSDVTEVEPGGTVTASGTGFPADTSGTVGLYAGDGTAVVEALVTTDADGAFAGTPLVVPAGTAAGDLALRATVGDATSPDVTITVTETPAEPVLTAAPTTVDSADDEAGRTVTVDGTGFTADLAGRVSIMTGAPGSGGTEVVGADVTTGPDGVLPSTPLVVPAGQEAGDYHVHAEYEGVVVDDVALTVTSTPPVEPVFTASPTEVDSGGDEAARTVTASGTDFPTDLAGRVSIMDDAAAEVVGADVTTDATGVLPDTPLVVPAGQAAGAYTVHAEYEGVTVDDVDLTVTSTPPPDPQITPDVTEAEPGDTVTISGTGFPADSTGRVGIATETDEIVGADVTADASGAFPATALVIPAGTAAGEYIARATLGGVTSPDVTITVTEAPPPEPVQLGAPTGVAAGTPTATEVPLTWDAVTNATAYRIESSADGTTWTADETEPTDPAGSATGLTAATEYQLRVTAIGDGTEYTDSEPSASVTATTAAALAESATAKRSKKKS